MIPTGGIVAEVIKVFLSNPDVQFVLIVSMFSLTLLYIVMNFIDGRG